MRLNHFQKFVLSEKIDDQILLTGFGLSHSGQLQKKILEHHWCSPSHFADEIIEMYAAIDDKPNN